MGFLFFTRDDLRLTVVCLRYAPCAVFTPPEPWRRRALLVLRSPARRDAGGYPAEDTSYWKKPLLDLLTTLSNNTQYIE
jgi:hypothetical protein